MILFNQKLLTRFSFIAHLCVPIARQSNYMFAFMRSFVSVQKEKEKKKEKLIHENSYIRNAWREFVQIW